MCAVHSVKVTHFFTQASNGQKFLTEFIEVGGLLTLLEIIGQQRTSEGDKGNIEFL